MLQCRNWHPHQSLQSSSTHGLSGYLVFTVCVPVLVSVYLACSCRVLSMEAGRPSMSLKHTLSFSWVSLSRQMLSRPRPIPSVLFHRPVVWFLSRAPVTVNAPLSFLLLEVCGLPGSIDKIPLHYPASSCGKLSKAFSILDLDLYFKVQHHWGFWWQPTLASHSKWSSQLKAQTGHKMSLIPQTWAGFHSVSPIMSCDVMLAKCRPPLLACWPCNSLPHSATGVLCVVLGVLLSCHYSH